MMGLIHMTIQTIGKKSMFRSVWGFIKLTNNRKPDGDILLPSKEQRNESERNKQ